MRRLPPRFVSRPEPSIPQRGREQTAKVQALNFKEAFSLGHVEKGIQKKSSHLLSNPRVQIPSVELHVSELLQWMRLVHQFR